VPGVAPGVVVPGAVELPVDGGPGLVGFAGFAVDPADPLDAPGVTGKVPHGPPVGLFPGFVFGLVVEGAVPLPGVGGFGEFDPGTVDGVVEFGVAVLPGGVAVFPGGVAAGPPGVWPARQFPYCPMARSPQPAHSAQQPTSR
jgi:hypothetical protein